MSYLDVPRFHFAGEFLSDPSTLNNQRGSCCDPTVGTPPAECNHNLANPMPPVSDRNWNPNGKHHFTLQNCTVTGTLDSTGAFRNQSSADSLVGGTVSSSLDGRLVDLDPNQQFVSQIFGLELRVVDADGNGFTATMRTGTLRDLWARVPGGGMAGSGGVYQSVLIGVQWFTRGGLIRSRPLEELLQGSGDQLSIKLVLYAYDGARGTDVSPNPHFTAGKLVGTIGPARAGEPDHIPAARMLINSAATGSPFGRAPFKVDTARRKLVVDLGHAIPEKAPGKDREALGAMEALIDMAPPKPAVRLGSIKYDLAHYLQTAGIEEVALSAAQVGQLASRPLQIHTGTPARLVLAERMGSAEVDATESAVRLNPGEQSDVELVATRFGAPAASIDVNLDVTSGGPLTGLSLFTVSGTTATPVALPGIVQTAATGKVTIRLRAGDPGHPRAHLDGQLYGIGFSIGTPVTANLRGEIFVRVFERVTVPDNPQWSDVRDFLTGYARLYPSMTMIFDLSSERVVRTNRGLLATAVQRPETSPFYMPVSRDLSRDRKALLVSYLTTVGPPP